MIGTVLSRKKSTLTSTSVTNGKGGEIGREGREIRESRLLFLSGPKEIQRAREAMWKAHKSQMRWFRWGWIGLSRYMAVNDLVLEEVR